MSIVVRAACVLSLALTSGCALLVSFSGYAGGPDIADAASDASRDCPPDACQTIGPPSDGEAGDVAATPDVDAPSPIDGPSPSSITRVQTAAPGWMSAQEITLTLVQENPGDLLVAGHDVTHPEHLVVGGPDRADLEEVFRLAQLGVGRAHIEEHALDEAPELFDAMRRGEILGRAVVVF